MFEELLTSAIEAYGPLGLFVVMILQTIIAPIPSEAMLVFAGAIGINLFDVIVFGGTGLLVGSVIAFYVARKGGKILVQKLLGEKWSNRMNGWIDRNGAKSILITRLIPFIPFDLISYISGVTSLSFKSYFIATILGAFPRCFILAVMGTIAKGFLSTIGIGIELTFLIGIAALVVIVYLDNKGYLESLKNKLIKRTIRDIFSRKKSEE